MRVLDIDLDFFLAGCCPLADKGRRPELLAMSRGKAGECGAFLRAIAD